MSATRYRMSREPFGPWLRPRVDMLDGPAARVMKTAPFAEGRRLGVAWLGTRREERDDGPFQFGGNALFRELVQHGDGTLGAKFPEEMVPTGSAASTRLSALGADAKVEGNQVELAARQGLSAGECTGVPRDVRLRTRVSPRPGSAEFGFRFGADEAFDSGYDLQFLPGERIVRLQNQWIFGVEGLDRPFTLEVVLKEDIVDVCIDGRRTLVDRCPERRDGGDLGRIAALGEMVGRMHRCADRMRGVYRRDHLDMRHLVDENLRAIAPLMAHRGAEFELIRRIGEACRSRIEGLLPVRKPEYGICHGDLHGGDVCYDEENRPVLFDFDSSGCGWRALDLGVFLASDEWMDVSCAAEERRQRQLSVFVEGYSRIRELSANELAAVQLGPPVRHIFLMGHVLRYTAVQEGEHWADDGFIDWHMNWFGQWAEGNL